LNDAAILDLDGHNNGRERWERIDEQIPNDYRDCERYAYVAFLVTTRGGNVRAPSSPAQAKPRGTVLNPGISRPDGRSWV
jgi:hypothetical protein